MKRGAALRGVMAAKGCDKPETLETMAREWVGGMLVATYALEKAASSRRFAVRVRGPAAPAPAKKSVDGRVAAALAATGAVLRRLRE